MDTPPTIIVDTLLLALQVGSKTEAEVVAECVDIAKHDLLDWNHLRNKDAQLYQKVWDSCKKHPPEL